MLELVVIVVGAVIFALTPRFLRRVRRERLGMPTLRRWRDPQVAATVLASGVAVLLAGIGLLALDVGADHRLGAILAIVGIPVALFGAYLIQWGPVPTIHAVEYPSATVNSERQIKNEHMVDELIASAERADAKQVKREEETFKEMIQAFNDGIWLRNKLVQAIQQKISNKRTEPYFSGLKTWVEKTKTRIEAAMSPDEVRRFNDLSGISPAQIIGGTQKQQRYFQAVDCYMQRLGELIDVYYATLDSKYGFKDAPAPAVPAVRVTPVIERGLKCLAVENIGGSAEFRAQIDVVEGKAAWIESTAWVPSMPYIGCWEGAPGEAIRLYQGQRALLAVFGLLQQRSRGEDFLLPQFMHYDSWKSHASFFGKRLETTDDIEQRDPLVFQVTIGSLPSMAQPFVRFYRLAKSGPLEEVSYL